MNKITAVINELETLKEIAEKSLKIAKDNHGIEALYFEGLITGIKTAIRLLRNTNEQEI